jgi:hypothetical protein
MKHRELSASPDMLRWQGQIFYFGDQGGLDGLKTHLGDGDSSLQL